jgi:glycosyltransferase involved in cell wall biosynthesis
MSKTVCFDIRALQIGHENRGIGMYIRSVLEHIPADDNRYILYSFDGNNPVEDLALKLQFDYTLVTTPTINTVFESPKHVLGILRLVCHRFAPLRKFKPDTFMQFDAQLGLPNWRKTKKVVIGYDLIPLIMRNEYNPTIKYAWRHSFGKKAKIRGVLRSMYYGFRYKLTYMCYKKADKVLCISQDSAKSFSHILHIKERRLVAIPLAPVLPTGKPDDSIASGIDKPFIFYIGGTDARKRIVDIVRAFNIVRGRGQNIALVFAGNEFKKVEHIPDVEGRNAIMDSPYRSDIHLVGFVTNEQKLGLYGKALAFVFTSQYEGFGLPVIEAMATGCPVIAYNNSSIPEAAGNAALLVDTLNYSAIAAAIQDLYSGDALRSQLIREGRARAKLFAWESYIDSLSKLLN